MFIIMIFFFLIFNLIKRSAMECKSYFGKYLAIGIGGYLITQVLINIYVALGMLPVFGIPMPIFSYGGTSPHNYIFSFWNNRKYKLRRIKKI